MSAATVAVMAGVFDAVSERQYRATKFLRDDDAKHTVERMKLRGENPNGYHYVEREAKEATDELYGLADSLRPAPFMLMSVTLRRQVGMAHSLLTQALALVEDGRPVESIRFIELALDELRNLLNRQRHQARPSRSPSSYPDARQSLENAVRRSSELESRFKRLLVAP